MLEVLMVASESKVASDALYLRTLLMEARTQPLVLVADEVIMRAIVAVVMVAARV